MKVAQSSPVTLTVAPARAKETSQAAPGHHDAYVPSHGSRFTEGLVNTVGFAGAAAGIAALTTAFAPEGSGFSHVVRGLALTGVAGVGGAFACAMAGDKIGNLAEKLAGTSHSADERIGNSIGGLLVGGGAGVAAAIGSSFFGQSPLAAAATAATVVGVGGVALALLDKFQK